MRDHHHPRPLFSPLRQHRSARSANLIMCIFLSIQPTCSCQISTTFTCIYLHSRMISCSNTDDLILPLKRQKRPLMQKGPKDPAVSTPWPGLDRSTTRCFTSAFFHFLLMQHLIRTHAWRQWVNPDPNWHWDTRSRRRKWDLGAQVCLLHVEMLHWQFNGQTPR